LDTVLNKVNERGRWTVAELEKAVEAISERLGEWFRWLGMRQITYTYGDFTRQN
jgi:hypothetical protein